MTISHTAGKDGNSLLYFDNVTGIINKKSHSSRMAFFIYMDSSKNSA